MRDSDDKYLVFTLEGEKYSICFSDVRMIIPADPENPPKKVPDMPDYVLGTIIHEKETVTVLSLRRRFRMPFKALSDRDCIILCDGAKRLGLLCDSIVGFREVPETELQPAPDVNEQANARFISGGFLTEEGTCWVIKPELVIRAEDEAAFDAMES